MGWKRALRSIDAANNRSQRDQERRGRVADRAVRSVERDGETAIKRARATEDRLRKDVIKAANLEYEEGVGFRSRPVEVETPSLSFSISVSSDGDADVEVRFEPPSHSGSALTVRPLDVMVTQWATIVALRVENNDAEYRGRISWVKKSEPEESALWLLDPEASRYYYPTSTNLRGEVLPGHPRVGLVAFAPMDRATEELELHFLSLKLGSEREKSPPFHFRLLAPDLANQVDHNLVKSTLADQIVAAVASNNEEADTAARKAASGCLVPLILLGTAAAVRAAWALLP